MRQDMNVVSARLEKSSVSWFLKQMLLTFQIKLSQLILLLFSGCLIFDRQDKH